MCFINKSEEIKNPRKNIEAWSEKIKEIEKDKSNHNSKRSYFDDEEEDDLMLLEHLNYFESNSVAFAFYSYKRNEIFVINWKTF